MTWSDTTSLSSFVLMDVLVSTDLSETLQLVLLLYPSVIDSDQSRESGGHVTSIMWTYTYIHRY